jgi:hypothetical protein
MIKRKTEVRRRERSQTLSSCIKKESRRFDPSSLYLLPSINEPYIYTPTFTQNNREIGIIHDIMINTMKPKKL